ncbi:rRNA maturation RNase YbeY [bacterium]|nr:rRNA maturation RNase YbeY [bacterium]
MKLLLVDRRTPGAGSAPWNGAPADWPALLGPVVDGLGVRDWTVNLVLVGDQAMTDLNRTYRGGADVTDVLSFSYLDREGSGPPDLTAGERGAAGDLWSSATGGSGEDPVGEVVIAPAFVAARCAAEGWDPGAEFNLLVVHGCLHVLGWEHDDPARRTAMQTLEADRLALLGLPHPLLERS